MRSCVVRFEGGVEFAEMMKPRAKAIVRVETDDAQIDLGYLLDREPHQIRVMHCLGYVRDHYDFAKRQKWQVVTIPHDRVRRAVVLN